MKIMYVQHRFGPPSPLLPDETLCHTQQSLRAVTYYCTPLSRGAYERFFCHMLLRITDRRVNISCRLFLFIYRQEVDLWLPGHQPEGPVDTIEAISVKTGVFGPCVELHSRGPLHRQSLFSSPYLRVRIYNDDPDHVAGAIRGAICDTQDPTGPLFGFTEKRTP